MDFLVPCVEPHKPQSKPGAAAYTGHSNCKSRLSEKQQVQTTHNWRDQGCQIKATRWRGVLQPEHRHSLKGSVETT